MSRSTGVRAVLVAVALAVGMLAPPAVAEDHEPPRTILETATASQRGRLGNECWIYPVEGGYVQQCIDRIPTWPRIERARAGAPATIVLLKPTRPEQIHLEYWRRIDRNGFPVGRARPLSFGLRPGVRAGEPVWEVTFRLPDSDRVYLRLFGIWLDEQVDGSPPQDAEWFFRLRLA